MGKDMSISHYEKLLLSLMNLFYSDKFYMAGELYNSFDSFIVGMKCNVTCYKHNHRGGLQQQ